MKLHLVRLAIGSIRSRRTRSWLTVIGVLIGVTAVVSLLSIGTGVERAVLQQFKDIGYDIIVITSGGGTALPAVAGRAFTPGATGASGLAPAPSVGDPAATGRAFDPTQIGQPTAAPSGTATGLRATTSAPSVDTAKLVQAVPGLTEAGNLGTRVVRVDGPEASGFLRLTTPSQSFLQAFPSILGGFKIGSGTSFTGTTRNEVIVGARSAASLGVNVGDAITGDGERFTVVGILAFLGTASAGTAQSARGAQGVRGTPTSVQQIAAVALIVGGVGMMNTMYTSVLERTREIGILKAVGARDGQVMALFLVDSGLMGLIGGILGLVAGGLLSLFGTRLLGPALGVGSFHPVFEASLILAVVAGSFVIGALSGSWPAWRASRLNPVEALAAE